MKDASCTIMNPRGKRKVKSHVLIFILKFLASDEAKPIREMVVKKHCNPDLCLWNRHTMGKGAKMSINQLVKEKGWTWEELKMEGLRWYDNSHGSRMGHDWDDIVQLALAWSACN